MLRHFRRVVLKVREAIAAIPDDATLHASFRVEAGQLAVAEFEKPDEESKVRVAVLMWPLLNPESEIECRRVWNLIKSTRDLDPATVANVEQSFHNIEEGWIPLTVNQRRVTQREIYETFAEGEFFSQSKSAVAMLKSMRFGPVTPLLWMSFYAYTHDMARLASMMLDVAATNPSTDAPAPHDDEPQVDLGRCVYCLKSEGPFRSEEHIIPEGLGNDDAVLSPGYVCDPCNNECSKLDEYFVNFEAISLQRVLVVPFTKKGKLPRADFGNLTIEKRMPRAVRFIHKKGDNPYRESEHKPDGTFRFEVNVKGKKPTDFVRIGRALYKIGLGMVALHAGRERACQPRYDAARDFIAGRTKSFDNNLALLTKTTPHGNVTFHWWDSEVGTVCVADFYGVQMVFNLEPLPIVGPEPSDESAALFAVIPLR
jgi:hypothetical protein